MKNCHKILYLTAALSCLAFLPGKESSAKDVMPNTTEIQQEQNSIFMPNISPTTQKGGDTFNPDVAFVEYEKDILQEDTHTLEIENLEKNCDVTFKSSNTDVLTVEQTSNNTCTYTGIGYGKAKVTVTITKTTAFIFKEKKTISANINVTPKAVSIVFRQSVRKISLDSKNKKLHYTLRPSISKEVPAFKSSNKKIVTINKKGKVTAKKLGSVYITATLLNGKSAKCRIMVLEGPQQDDEPDDEE